jgi:lipopolysaccharide assembly protein A
MKLFKRIVLFAIILIIIIFSVQNSEIYSLKLFNWKVELPVSILVFLVYILGMTTGGILFSVIKNLLDPDSKKKTVHHVDEENRVV